MNKKRKLKQRSALSDEKKKSIIKMIEIRLDGIGEATRRAKIAFIITVIASCAMLITIFNTYHSFTRGRGFEDTFKFKAVSIKNECEFLKSLQERRADNDVVKKINEIYLGSYESKYSLKNLSVLLTDTCIIDSKIYNYQNQKDPIVELEFKKNIEELEFQKKQLIRPYLEIINNNVLDDKLFYQKINNELNDIFLDNKDKTDANNTLGLLRNIIENKILDEGTAEFYENGSNHVNKLILEKTFPQIEWNTSFSEKYLPYSLYEHNKRAISEEWIENQNIGIGPLGISVNVDQFSLLGSATLTIVSFWMLFSLRRENRAIVTLLRDVKEEVKRPKDRGETYKPGEYKDDAWDIANLAFHGIVHKLVFAQTGKTDKPMSVKHVFDKKSESQQEKDRSTSSEADNFASARLTVDDIVGGLTWIIRWIVAVLFFLPIIAIGTILYNDYWTTFNTLYPYSSNPASSLIQRNIEEFPTQILVELVIGFICLIITSASCFSCLIFQWKTTQVLNEFDSRLKRASEIRLPDKKG